MKLRTIAIAAALAVLALYGGLIASLGWFLDPAALRAAWFSERTLFSVRISLVAATGSASLALVLAVPAAYALSSGSRNTCCDLSSRSPGSCWRNS